jgi:hypothetical protein
LKQTLTPHNHAAFARFNNIWDKPALKVMRKGVPSQLGFSRSRQRDQARDRVRE